MDCPAGHVHEADKRAANFQTVLRAFGFPFSDTPITTSQPVSSDSNTTGQDTTAAPETTGSPTTPSGGDCGNCATCVYNPSNPGNQTATDEQCQACAAGQTWWPCNVEKLCQCAGSPQPTVAPTTAAPETTAAPTTAPPTVAPTTTAAPTTTTQKYTTKDCTQTEAPQPEVTTEAPQPSGACDASCTKCVAIPGNFQAASDEACSACGGATNQQWWPCLNAGQDLGLCQCAGRNLGDLVV